MITPPGIFILFAFINSPQPLQTNAHQILQESLNAHGAVWNTIEVYEISGVGFTGNGDTDSTSVAYGITIQVDPSNHSIKIQEQRRVAHRFVSNTVIFKNNRKFSLNDNGQFTEHSLSESAIALSSANEKLPHLLIDFLLQQPTNNLTVVKDVEKNELYISYRTTNFRHRLYLDKENLICVRLEKYSNTSTNTESPIEIIEWSSYQPFKSAQFPGRVSIKQQGKIRTNYSQSANAIPFFIEHWTPELFSCHRKKISAFDLSGQSAIDFELLTTFFRLSSNYFGLNIFQFF
jgi:hypothetical protein